VDNPVLDKEDADGPGNLCDLIDLPDLRARRIVVDFFEVRWQGLPDPDKLDYLQSPLVGDKSLLAGIPFGH
jgi:hypothetical protein